MGALRKPSANRPNPKRSAHCSLPRLLWPTLTEFAYPQAALHGFSLMVPFPARPQLPAAARAATAAGRCPSCRKPRSQPMRSADGCSHWKKFRHLGWLERRPQLGYDVFALGRPEIFLGTRPRPRARLTWWNSSGR